MELQAPVTFTPPSLTKPDGTVKTFNPITLTELDITLMDNPKRRVAQVRIAPCPKPLTLWSGDAYDEAGDYTQAQVEARILELLGFNQGGALAELFRIGPPVV